MAVPSMTMPSDVEKIRWLLVLVFLGVLIAGLYVVFRPFLHVIAWSVVIVSTIWPIYQRIRRLMPLRPGLSALIMTILLGGVLFAAVTPVVIGVANELETSLRSAKDLFNPEKKEELIANFRKVPYVGPNLGHVVEDVLNSPISESLNSHGVQLAQVATSAAKGIFGFVFKFLVFLFISFFLFRDGQSGVIHLQRALIKIGGERFERLLAAIRVTLRATVYGLLVTAIAQGILAGAGYYIAGTPVPMLLGAATMLISLLPFGPPLVYVPASGILYLNGAPWWNVMALLLWGILVVSTIDNVLRPLFISQQAKLSVAFVFIGVIGGTLAFGLIGVFLGPILIALAKTIWDEIKGTVTISPSAK